MITLWFLFYGTYNFYKKRVKLIIIQYLGIYLSTYLYRYRETGRYIDR